MYSDKINQFFSGSEKCADCSPGSFSLAQAPKCTACSPGTIAPLKASFKGFCDRSPVISVA